MKMNVEEKRLRTFREWPANAAVDPVRLAKAGFYYTGHILEVQCFLCGTKISDWNYGDQAMVRHRLKAPNCPFVRDSASTCNVPLIPVADNTTAVESTTQSRQLLDLQQSNSVGNNSSMVQRPMDPSKEYSTITQRLLSFNNWPISSIVHPEQLALAGFYYLQCEDMVECAFCRGILMNWKPGDDPDCAHRLSFPNCDFYMRRDTEDDLLGLVRVIPETITNMTELGIQRHKAPQRPEYTTYEKRLQTFRGWPKNLKQTPEMLAEAGFYYGGYEDQVRCFHCDGGLRYWQPTDDVWVEHARWFSNCGFVNLIRGHEFVKYCINNRTPLDLSIITGISEEDNAAETSIESLSSIPQSNESDAMASVADVAATSITSLPTISQLSESTTGTIADAAEATVVSLPTILRSNEPITNAAVEKLLETVPAKTALEIGLHVGRVKRALKKRMERFGKPYTDVVQLIQDVLHDQVLEEDNGCDNGTSDSPTSELNNLFNQVTMQIANNSTNKNNAQESDAFEKEVEERKRDNESDDLMSLREENRRLKEARLCKVCMDHELAVVFLPCGHLATCNNCAPALANCPLCRLGIRAYVRIFLS
ncbi:baculoviral IAP repeat-containing protein 7-A isoform X1 [Pogonomyrmex barbatus]|uniref:Baculoviral IAP repeat-containing protein 7-A isoform X1 n=1 Tax=Pogonomyrmex barbatus TaxID=144034 RepID=A0A6I9VRY5_9HYME|nr:baculoviral IAP repeat-containing protein 7-A isoform X1 [Pogonomyrmex barbatus]